MDAAGLDGQDFEGIGGVGEAKGVIGMAFVVFVAADDVNDGAGRAEAGGPCGNEGELAVGLSLLNEDESVQPIGEGVSGAGADLLEGPAGLANGIGGFEDVLAGWGGKLFDGGGDGAESEEVEGKLGGADGMEFDALARWGRGDETGVVSDDSEVEWGDRAWLIGGQGDGGMEWDGWGGGGVPAFWWWS